VKKIFSILFALVLLLGLGLVTAAPVLADGSPGSTDIDKVAAGWYHTVGLKDDGTVVAVGLNDYGQCDVDDWILKLPSVPEETYTLTITADPGVGGAATDETGGSPYAAGAEVSIKAVANPGYGFVGWTAPAGAFGDETAEETTFTMPAQGVTVTAHFDVVSLPEVPTVTTQAATGISSYSGTVNMSYTVGNFSPVEVRVACKRLTDPAWFYTTWVPRTADGTYTELLTGLISQTEYEFKAQLKYNGTVIEGTTRQFTTETPTYNLTISSTAGGSVTAPGVGTFTYDRGTVVDLVAEAEDGYRFVNWDGDVGTIAKVNAATTTIIMQGDCEITARFVGVGPAKTETVTGYGIVDAIVEADTQVVVNGNATVTIFKYDSNPHPEAPVYGALASLDLLVEEEWVELKDIFRDVYVTNTTDETEMKIKLYYTDAQARGFNETSLQPLWLNGDDWVACSDSGVNTTDITINNIKYSGYMWATINNTTTPSLAALNGTPWGGYGHPTEAPPCCTATVAAASGTNAVKKLNVLRQFRDAVLLPDASGAKLVSFYYRTSPPIADFISQHEVLRTAVRVGLVDPIVRILIWSHGSWSARGSQ
jgi:uncharacterized repeat protein (TIGR02543 family)